MVVDQVIGVKAPESKDAPVGLGLQGPLFTIHGQPVIGKKIRPRVSDTIDRHGHRPDQMLDPGELLLGQSGGGQG